MHRAIAAVNDAAISAPKTLKWQLMCSTKLYYTLYNFICSQWGYADTESTKKPL